MTQRDARREHWRGVVEERGGSGEGVGKGWGHFVRGRGFVEAMSSRPREASEMVARIRGLYAIEKEVREADPETRRAARQSQAAPQLEAIFSRVDELRPLVTPAEPLIVTSNKSWSAWGDILPDQVMTAAILDRLLHRSITLNIQGESYRLRQHRQAGLIPSPLSLPQGGDCHPKTVKS